ncbi:MAG TPA: hypothetical protein VKT22_10830 [Steroidobacteraceae bacterium]|nr:hypothetical protein [Steroidobacteraceae bacterium]
MSLDASALKKALRVGTCALALAGCGASSPAGHVASADVLVTFDGKRHACVVALKDEPQGSSVSCDEVVPFVRDELRLPSGAHYDTRTVASFDQATIARVEAGLKGAGYQPVAED